MTKKLQELLDNFESACKSFGYQESEGYGEYLNLSEKSFEESKAKLIKYLEKLQKRANRKSK